MSIFLIIVGISLALVSVARQYRNNRVFEYRMKLLDRMEASSTRDFANGDYSRWELRNQEFGSVKYQEMVNKFWKPLDSFYEGTSLLEPPSCRSSDEL